MLKRLLLAVALPVLAASTAHGQTTFFANGGNVVFTPTSLGFTPFQLFLDAVGNSHRLVASSDGTIFTLDTRGSVAIVGYASLGPLTLGNFAAGSGLVFTYVINGRSYNTDDFYRQVTTSLFRLDYADVNNPVLPSSDRLLFDLSGVGSATGLQCPGTSTLAPCSLLTPVTSTPEPGTIALFATGLAGLIPVAIRRRRATV